MDSSQSAGSWARLLLARVASGLGHDAALSNEENVTVRELLLELTGESLLDLVEGLELRNRDEDNNSLLTTANLNLKRGMKKIINIKINLTHVRYKKIVNQPTSLAEEI